MKFHLETYGCTANFGNSGKAEDALIRLGHTPATLEEAEVVIVNTCAVTERTERKVIRRLRQLQGPGLVIGGCLAAAIPDSLEGIPCLMKLGVLDARSIREMAGMLGTSTAKARAQTGTGIHDLCGIVNIAEGCTGMCSYCIVRRARGRLHSTPPDEVVASVEKLVESGVVEVQLAAQDTAAYGLDIGTSLPELLEAVSCLPGRFKVRLGMMNPDTAGPILEDLTAALLGPRIYRFVHMPLQSGSDRVLEAMGRRYSASEYLEITDRLRSSVPDIGIITDVICGFPGEVDEDHRATIDILKKAEPDKVNITRFSRRPGTHAHMLHDMPDRFKKDRSREMTRLWLDIASFRNRRYVGQVLDLLITERGLEGTMKARSENYTGAVIRGAADLGSTISARVLESNPHYITAIPVESQSRPGQGIPQPPLS